MTLGRLLTLASWLGVAAVLGGFGALALLGDTREPAGIWILAGHRLAPSLVGGIAFALSAAVFLACAAAVVRAARAR